MNPHTPRVFPQETPEQKSRRMKLPVIPPLPKIPPQELNPICAICGLCGLEIRETMMFYCGKTDCPVQIKPRC